MFWRQGVCNRKDEKACVVLVQQTDNCSLILVRYLRWHDICHRIRSNSACHGKVDAYPSVNLIQHWIPGTMAYRHSRLVESREGVASSRCHRNVWVLVHWMAFVCIHCEWRVEDWVSLAGRTSTHSEPVLLETYATFVVTWIYEQWLPHFLTGIIGLPHQHPWVHCTLPVVFW
jgi:hypothetical protein